MQLIKVGKRTEIVFMGREEALDLIIVQLERLGEYLKETSGGLVHPQVCVRTMASRQKAKFTIEATSLHCYNRSALAPTDSSILPIG